MSVLRRSLLDTDYKKARGTTGRPTGGSCSNPGEKQGWLEDAMKSEILIIF